MSYNTLKALVNSKIYENTEQRITGGDMNDVLQSAIASLGAHYQMGGLVSPTDHITVGDEPVVFIATTPGTYTYFGSQVVADGEVALLVWSGTAWSKQTPDISTRTEVNQLGQMVSLKNVCLEQYSTIPNKYPSSSGTLITLVSYDSFANVLKVPKSKTISLKWVASAVNVNFGILFSNDPTFATVDSYIAPYTVNDGEALIDVPDNVDYICMRNSATDVVRVVDGEESTENINDTIDAIVNDFNSFTPLTKHSAAKGYLNNSGQIAQTSSSDFGFILYSVTPGQVLFIQQDILPSAYGFYEFIDNADLTSFKVVQFVASNDGTKRKVIVPYGAKYLVINTNNNYAYAQSVDIPESVKILGYPKLDLEKVKTFGVYNYNTGYQYTDRSWGKEIIIRGIETSGDIFSSLGVYNFLRFTLSGNNEMAYIPKNKFRDALKLNRRIRLVFDGVCSVNKTIVFRLYHYNFQYLTLSVDFVANEIKHIDYIFPQISDTDIQSAADIALYAIATGGQLDIANLIITDEINEGKNITSKFEQDWTHKVVDQPNSYKQCIYIGDSISTANNYKWKQYIEETYKISYVRDSATGINPANGGIPVVPNMADESSKPDSQKSIWYRCASNRMGNKEFDIISLFGGTNDHDCAIGTINDTPYVDDASTFDTPANYTDVWTDTLTLAQCLMGCVEMLKRDFPNKLLVLTTVYPTDTTSIGSPERTLAKATLQCKIGQKYNIPVVPLYWKMREDAISAFTLDGVHPNTVWARQMAIAFAEVLEF